MVSLASGKKFYGYTIDRVLSDKYEDRMVYCVQNEKQEKSVLIIYDMDLFHGANCQLFGMEVPSEFYYAYILQKKVSPEVYDIGETHEPNHLCWLSQSFIYGIRLDSYLTCSESIEVKSRQDLALNLSNLICEFNNMLPDCAHINIAPKNIVLNLDNGQQSPYLIGLRHVEKIGSPGCCAPVNDSNMKYCAPEFLGGSYMANSNVYSIALIIYELLTTSLPWGLDNWQPSSLIDESYSSLNKLLSKELRLDELPESLREVLKKALSSSDIRYANIQVFHDEFFKELTKVVASQPTVEKEDDEDDVDLNDDDDEFLFSRLDDGQPKTTARIDKKAGHGFQLVAGMEQLKNDLIENFINVLRNPETAKMFGILPPNGMLLYGPPGCGKSYLASRLAEEVGISVSFVRPSELGSTYIHGSQSMIADLFDKAQKNAPTLLVFDEIDAIVPSRSKIENVSLSGEVNEFLTQLENCSQRGIFVVGTTNRIEQIDPAVLRTGRIEEIVYVPLPDKSNRLALLKMELKNKPCDKAIDFDRLADLTEHFTMSDISYTVKKACRKSFQLTIRDGLLHQISMASMVEAIETTTPSVDIKTEKEYERQLRERQSRNPIQPHSSIGFRTSSHSN